MSDITISDRAYQRICEIKSSRSDTVKSILKISVVSGGCSGLTYDLELLQPDEIMSSEHDHLYNYPDFTLHVDMRSYLLLAGTELDYSDGLDGKGFHFQNPNASRTCSCGESFSL